MKSKPHHFLMPVILAALFGSLLTQCVFGYEAEIQLNHKTFKTDFPFLQIHAMHVHLTNNEIVSFTVVVVPNHRYKPEDYEGRLDIKDGHSKDNSNLAAWASVQARIGPAAALGLPLPSTWTIPDRLKTNCVMFEFSVDTKYLESSQFRVEEELSGAPSDYIFDLKDFADEK